MRKLKPASDLKGQLKGAVSESQLIHQPLANLIRYYIERLGFWVVTTTTALLLFPFTWRSIIFEVFVFLLAISFAWNFVNRNLKNSTSLKLWTVAVVMFLFSAVCPFITAPKPAYVAVTASVNPLSSGVFTLKSSDTKFGSVIFLSDADIVRKTITPLLNRIFPYAVRLFDKTSYGDTTYYRLPIFKQFVIDRKEPGQVIWERTVYFPFNPIGRRINLELVKRRPLDTELTDEPNKVTFGVTTTTYGLVTFTYTQYPDTIPWDCVQVRPNQETSILPYAASLDRSLEYFAEGETSKAVNTRYTSRSTPPLIHSSAAPHRTVAASSNTSSVNFRNNAP